MTPPLHLLRPFTEWSHGSTGRPIETVDDAESWVRHIADAGFDRFCTWSSRTPRRAGEMGGGSVYFVRARRTLFRMPFVAVEPDGVDCAICMRPQLIRVAPYYVGMVRGWRYLEDADAPPDQAEIPAAGDAPPGMAEELKEMGLD